ncbi:MAG: hypothetical protein R2883_03230 [Caldisericia bacterium]
MLIITTWSTECNHVIAKIYPATRDDVQLRDNGKLFISGSIEEQIAYGVTTANDDDVQETTFHVTPDGDGQSVVYLSYMQKTCTTSQTSIAATIWISNSIAQNTTCLKTSITLIQPRDLMLLW